MMRKSKWLLLLAVVGMLWMLPVNARERATDSVLVLKNARVIDVLTGKMTAGVTVVVQHGVITAIGKRAGKHVVGKEIDIHGGYVVPGLIDTHIHVANGHGVKPERGLSLLNYLVKHGITTVRDAAGNAEVLHTLQTEIRNGDVVGADVYYAAFMAGRWYYDRGIGLRKEPYMAWEQCIEPGVDLDSAMAAAKACGATGIKLYHSIEGSYLPQVVRAAKKQGLKVWGHAMMYPAKPVEVVNAGVEVLSHVSMLTWLNPSDSVQRMFSARIYSKLTTQQKDSLLACIDVKPFCDAMKAHNAILDATLRVSYPRDEYVMPLLKRIYQQGVKISAGTDEITDTTQPYPHLMEELGYFIHNCGFTTLDALRSATIIGAEAIGEEKHIGSVTVGKKADLLVLQENPLQDIEHLKKQVMVIQAGRIITQAL
ncbi:amidohydrolase family protein [Filimonas lacunae]|nr:amidohydrolase family protein [Filimonas lacunae]